jgi:hypothetical protein
MKQLVIMPGGFHPFHAGHLALYNSATQAFPNADVKVAATNDTSTRPFPFKLKEKLAQLAGVPPGDFYQVKSPFRAEEITRSYDPADTQLIFVRSEKDATKPPQPGGIKRDGTPSYLQPISDQMAPMTQHAYMAYLPTVEFGPGMTSATQIRTAWPSLTERQRTALVMSLYPNTQKNPKLANTVVKMLDTAMGGEAVAEQGYGTHPSQRVDPRTGKRYVPPPSPLGQGVAEGLNEFAQGDFNGGDDSNDLQLYVNVAKKLNMKKYKPSTAHNLIAKKMAELVDTVDDEKVDWARHMARKAQGLPNMLDQGVAEGFPNFNREWGEATRYPEFVNLGKEKWIELVSKGKPVTVTRKNVNKINNTDAADPRSFKLLDAEKQKRALAQLATGNVEMPIVARYSDGHLELIGGNTRLTAQMAKDGQAKVWLFNVPEELQQGVAEGVPQPGKSSGKPISWIDPTKVATEYLTLDEILKSIPGIPYYNNVVDDRDKKDFTWGVTKRVIQYAKELIIRPDSYKNWPPIIVLDGKLQDGAHRISTIYLMQQRVQPNNPIWKNAKLKVEFGTSDNVKQDVDEEVTRQMSQGGLRASYQAKYNQPIAEDYLDEARS